MNNIIEVENHDLVMTVNGEAVCGCGVNFQGKPEVIALAWENHVKVPGLLQSLREQVELEYRSKQMVENTVRELAKLGVTTRIISDNTVVDGTTVISPTIAQRLVKQPTERPRRRYTRKTPAKKATTKKE